MLDFRLEPELSHQRCVLGVVERAEFRVLDDDLDNLSGVVQFINPLSKGRTSGGIGF